MTFPFDPYGQSPSGAEDDDSTHLEDPDLSDLLADLYPNGQVEDQTVDVRVYFRDDRDAEFHSALAVAFLGDYLRIIRNPDDDGGGVTIFPSGVVFSVTVVSPKVRLQAEKDAAAADRKREQERRAARANVQNAAVADMVDHSESEG